MKFCQPDLEVQAFDNFGSPYGSSWNSFGTPIPEHVLKISTKIYDA